jgi:hypothetical protein
MSIIANYFGVHVYNRARFLKNTITYQYYFVAGLKKSQDLIRNYLDKFPLYSSKFLDYKDWCKIIDLNNSKNLTKKEIISKSEIIKSGINEKRKLFTWDHLNEII